MTDTLKATAITAAKTLGVNGLTRVQLMQLSKAYLDLLDETPIDEEWAEKVRCNSVQLRCYRPNEDWQIVVHPHDRPNGVFYVTTRGQVRSLLLAAGIECEV